MYPISDPSRVYIGCKLHTCGKMSWLDPLTLLNPKEATKHRWVNITHEGINVSNWLGCIVWGAVNTPICWIASVMPIVGLSIIISCDIDLSQYHYWSQWRFAGQISHSSLLTIRLYRTLHNNGRLNQLNPDQTTQPLHPPPPPSVVFLMGGRLKYITHGNRRPKDLAEGCEGGA